MAMVSTVTVAVVDNDYDDYYVSISFYLISFAVTVFIRNEVTLYVAVDDVRGPQVGMMSWVFTYRQRRRYIHNEDWCTYESVWLLG